LEFDRAALEDLTWGVQQDRKKALPVLRLIEETQRDAFEGIGKPEPLNMNLPDAGPSESTRNIDWSIRCSMTRFASSPAAIIIKAGGQRVFDATPLPETP
jgi:Txe/YoeB family toxin of Txe-Axe toxin-antitoxin module